MCLSITLFHVLSMWIWLEYTKVIASVASVWCVVRILRSFGILKDEYLCKVPLPRVPRNQSTVPVAASATFPVNPHDTGYSPDPWIPLYNNLTRLLLDVSKLRFPLCLAGWFQLAISSIEQPFVYPLLIAIVSAINSSFDWSPPCPLKWEHLPSLWIPPSHLTMSRVSFAIPLLCIHARILQNSTLFACTL